MIELMIKYHCMVLEQLTFLLLLWHFKLHKAV